MADLFAPTAYERGFYMVVSLVCEANGWDAERTLAVIGQNIVLWDFLYFLHIKSVTRSLKSEIRLAEWIKIRNEILRSRSSTTIHEKDANIVQVE